MLNTLDCLRSDILDKLDEIKNKWGNCYWFETKIDVKSVMVVSRTYVNLKTCLESLSLRVISEWSCGLCLTFSHIGLLCGCVNQDEELGHMRMSLLSKRTGLDLGPPWVQAGKTLRSLCCPGDVGMAKREEGG